ncbi:MAG: hypothetical protein ISR65_05780 [Bacteriovoracaceae bacterium]|nr:hypothetical protein [Bacteriovoracaceae bacterium]
MVKIKTWTLIIASTLLITNESHAFFGMMMNMMKMPMQMMQGMNPMGGGNQNGKEGGMFGLMNNMVNGMTDGMKLGFQGIDCFGDKIGLMSNRITSFAGRGRTTPTQGYGAQCDFDRIPLATGQTSQSEIAQQTGSRGEQITTRPRRGNPGPRRPRRRLRTRLAINDPNDTTTPAPRKRARLRLSRQTLTAANKPVILVKPFTGQQLDLEQAPELLTDNNAKKMYIHIILPELLPELIGAQGINASFDTKRMAHVFIYDTQQDWSTIWTTGLKYLAQENLLQSDKVILSVTTFSKNSQLGKYPDTNYVPVTVAGLKGYSQQINSQQ